MLRRIRRVEITVKRDSLALALEKAAQIMAGTVTYHGYEKELARALIELWQKQSTAPEVAQLVQNVVDAARATLTEQRREFARGDIGDLDALEDALTALDSVPSPRGTK